MQGKVLLINDDQKVIDHFIDDFLFICNNDSLNVARKVFLRKGKVVYFTDMDDQNTLDNLTFIKGDKEDMVKLSDIVVLTTNKLNLNQKQIIKIAKKLNKPIFFPEGMYLNEQKDICLIPISSIDEIELI